MEEKYIQNYEKNLKIYESSSFIKFLRKPFKILFVRVIIFFLSLFKKTYRITTKTFWNDNFNVIFPDLYSVIIYKYGFVEEYLITYMLNFLKEGNTFIDIGAHFGFFSALASKLVGDKGKVYSFEPTRDTFNVLKLNMKSRKNVSLNNMAMWNSDGKIEFHDFGTSNSALNTIKDPRVNNEESHLLNSKSYEVKTITLDKFCNEKKIIPDFIKIDAENSEMEILMGMENIISEYYPVIVIEVGDYNNENISRSRNLIEFLINKSYKPFEYKNGNIIDHVLKETYEYNLLLFKK